MVLLNAQVKKQINKNGFICGICSLEEFSKACLTLHICLSKITEVPFFFPPPKYLIDNHLPQPEVLGYVIYNINILEKNRVIFNLDKQIY